MVDKRRDESGGQDTLDLRFVFGTVQGSLGEEG